MIIKNEIQLTVNLFMKQLRNNQKIIISFIHDNSSTFLDPSPTIKTEIPATDVQRNLPR